ncbi:MAG: hypothetical protein Q7R50_08340 [Dehalococcoidales bacterium]|nr:hypothetical protein [Dehalococcoidales bacterium]
MGDKEIKSAFELAMEKLEKMGDSTEEERTEWKYVPEGEKLGVRYIKEDFDLFGSLNGFSGNARKYVIQGITEVLIRNIGLPHTEVAKKTTKKAMDALKMLKNDKVKTEAVLTQFRRLFDHYATQGDQQRKQALMSLKADFEDRLQESAKQQGMAVVGKIDVEKQPQFLQEWHKMQSQLDSQYLKLMSEYKQELTTIS